jgi:hypothetical protein
MAVGSQAEDVKQVRVRNRSYKREECSGTLSTVQAVK